MWLTILMACRKQPAPEPAPVEVPETRTATPVPDAPEQATGCRTDIEPVETSGALVVSAHPESSAIGASILAQGGNAMDAAVGVAVALTLVEPQSSGLGGGAFLLHYDASEGAITAWDGRETAPRAGGPQMFMADGEAREWAEVVPGGLSVGVPGVLRMLERAHEAHGAEPFADLLRPTAELARTGFTVTPRMARSIRQMEERQDVLRRHPGARAYFYPDGEPLAAGHVLKNPALAETVERIATEGTGVFYGGEIGRHIVDAVQQAPVNPGAMTLQDLAGYRAVQREPVCTTFREHRVCGHPPPTSGGVTTLQILAQLDRFELADPDDPTFLHLFSDSVALAWADRERYLGDPAIGVPTQALLAPDYLAARSALLDPAARASIAPGDVPFAPSDAPLCPEGKDTTHLVIVDAQGDVVSMTSSIENAWGSGVFVDGFLLNNQLTDFARDPRGPDGQTVANAAAACKRPRSSMSPLIVTDAEGQAVMAVGSPGGAAIIQYTARSVIGALAQGLTLQQAVERPNIVRYGDKLMIEDDCGRPRVPQASRETLRALGHDVITRSFNSGLHGIERTEDGRWRSAIDPRREGKAISVEASP